MIDVRLLTKGGASGIEEYTRNLIGTLLSIDTNNQYQLFYNGFQKAPLQLQVSSDKLQVLDWRVPNKLLDASVRFLGWPKLDRLVSADVIFSPHFNIVATASVPRVITFHDISFIHHPYFFSWKQKLWHWLQDARSQAHSARKIIAVSEFTKADLIQSFGLPAEKIEVVYSGISSEFQPASVSSYKSQVFSSPYILYLGTLEPRKNVDAIIRAFNLLKQKPAFKDLQLVLAGRPGWLYGQVVSEFHRSPYQKDIVLRGGVTDAERVQLYQGARAFVYPSLFEGFGLPPLEAQACGCPVVASDRTSLPEILGQSALLVNPWKVEELAEAIEASIVDSKRRDSLIAAGLANVKRFSWQKTAEQVLRVLQSTYSIHEQ